MKDNDARSFSPWLARSAMLYVIIWLFLLFDRKLVFLESNPLFSNPITFAGSYLLGLALVIPALKSAKSIKGILIAGLVCAMAFPWLSPFLYGEYVLSVLPAPELDMVWVTEPNSSVAGALRTAQQQHEASWCSYLLAGWTDDNVLYYKSSCQPGFWRYDPNQEQAKAENSILGGFNDLAVETAGYFVDNPGIIPELKFGQRASRVFYSAASADGAYIASMVGDDNGIQDIVVVKSNE